ncbi:hypothetical protein B0H12DRAFT_427164 [Mycena haematopus]|nr:hypothetical protein B0H12DRAFT_427164 [Mycena haematopus]
MPYLRPSHLAFLFLLPFLFLAVSPVDAVPLAIKRQSDGQSFMTQTTTSTPAGDMTQTCVVTLIPITDDNGNAAVREVKTCTLTLANGTTNNGGTNSSSSSTTDSSSTPDSSSSGNSTSSSSTDGSPVSVNGVSAVPASATDSASASASSASETGASDPSNLGAGAAEPVSAGVVSLISAPATAANGGISAATATPVAAAEQAPSSSASPSAFVVPGQSIQVLPIGLGIFGALSGIALIVVGILTYKRRAYRKLFRAKKLAEAGAAMGYGGTKA